MLGECRKYTSEGNVASYIPELMKSDPSKLGITIVNCDGRKICAGDYDFKFTIQSVSKPIVLMLALMEYGEERVFSKVGKEPTGDPFNSLRRLETFTECKKPFNPMINAGAIAITSLFEGKDNEERLNKVLDFIKKLTGNPNIAVNEDVYLSEKRTGHKNRAMAHYLKDLGVIEGDAEEVVDLYFKHCSIEATAEDLANIASVLACGGKNINTGEVLIPKRVTRIVNTLMTTCGMYDESGEFAVDVGFPSKSGVGGGIISAVPGKMGIAVYGPALDKKGNSYAGVKLLELISNEFKLSIY
jgi:glutaminase